MIKVAFIDHHLKNWHADTFVRLLRGPLAEEGVEVVSAWESDPVGEEDWCEKQSIRRADSIEDAVRDADAVVVLAPDNVEEHPKLCAAVLPFGKPTMIDKFLAPTYEEAKEIVELAGRHDASIFSSSSLRYAVEMEAAMGELQAGEAVDGRFTGMGKWAGYGVHTLSMALRVMGCGVQRMIDTGTADGRNVTLDFGGGKKATLDVRHAANEWDHFGWSFAAKVGDKYVGAKIADFEGFYANLMRRMAAFFRSGQADMPIEEALWTVRLLRGAEESQAKGGEWIDFQ
jgi:predicted dehydrogenase